MVQKFDVGVTASITTIDTVAALSSGTIDVIKDITKISSGTIDYIARLGGTSDLRLVSDAVGLMKSTSGTIAQVASIPALDVNLSTRMPATGGTIAEVASVASLGGTSDWRLVSDAVGLMKSTGGTIAQVTSLGGTSDFYLKSRRYEPATLFSSSVFTSTVDLVSSSEVDISPYTTKTVSLYLTGTTGTLEIHIDPLTAGTINKYYSDTAVASGVFTTKSFSEVFQRMLVKVQVGTASGTVSSWLGSQT